MTRPRFLRLSSVSDRTGLSKTTIYKKICDGSFPAQIRLSERAVGWGSIPVRSAISLAFTDFLSYLYVDKDLLGFRGRPKRETIEPDP